MTTKPKQQPLITDDLKAQILAVRDTGRTNMFVIANVQAIAYEMDYFDLALFLENRENHKVYFNFILNGTQ